MAEPDDKAKGEAPDLRLGMPPGWMGDPVNELRALFAAYEALAEVLIETGVLKRDLIKQRLRQYADVAERGEHLEQMARLDDLADALGPKP